MRESEVERRFAEYLRSRGWVVTLGDRSHVDVIAQHPDGSRLLAEVKGVTKDSGTSADILFGQLLRRMTDLTGSTRYAVVVPESLRRTIERVPAEVRRTLSIELWVVPDTGDPQQVR